MVAEVEYGEGVRVTCQLLLLVLLVLLVLEVLPLLEVLLVLEVLEVLWIMCLVRGCLFGSSLFGKPL